MSWLIRGTGTLLLKKLNNLVSITFCIPSKNNLRYLKSSIKSIQENSTYDNKIIVWVDSSNDGTLEWLAENKIDHIINHKDKPQGIAAGYNRCIEAAETDAVCMFHADMYMAKGFDANLVKHLKPGTVVSATRIEPPLHPPGLEKIVKDFGMYPEDFKKDEFANFVDKACVEYKDQVTYGIFAPWACYKSDVLAIGLHDEYFHSYHEDSDIFNRMILSGMKCVQSRDAFVYHLTCRGGQFQDGVERITADPQFHAMTAIAQRHYLRKWGSWIKNNEYQHPIIPHKYNIAFVVRNCNYNLLESLEPWCDRIYIDDDMDVLSTTYTQNEQPNTKYDLSKRVLHTKLNDPYSENDIVVEFNAKDFDQQAFDIVQKLSEILTDSGDVGQFELHCFKITINSLQSYEKDLIVCNIT